MASSSTMFRTDIIPQSHIHSPHLELGGDYDLKIYLNKHKLFFFPWTLLIQSPLSFIQNRRPESGWGSGKAFYSTN